MRISNLKIGARLGGGFAAMLVLITVVALLGINSMSRIQERLDDIVNTNNVASKLVVAMRVSLYERMVAVRNLALLTEMTERQPQVARMKEQAQKYSDSESKLNAMLASRAGTTQEEKDLMVKIKRAEKETEPLLNKAVELATAGKDAETTQVLVKEVRPVQEAWKERLGDLVSAETKLNEQAGAAASASYQSARTMMILLGLLAGAVGAVLAYLITRSVTAPLNQAVAIAQTVAAGDLSSRIVVDRKDETGQLLQALKDMNDSLVNIVGEVRQGTDNIATASSQIASGNVDLSSRTEEQAASLEETAASMEELTGTVKQNADNARQGSALAATATATATKGNEVVSRVVTMMGQINESSTKIADIISIIEGIAFQTNILALNAAVEAARAGEQGRGFAVVAGEVRSLAQRSSSAAKEIKDLIQNSVERVQAGTTLVGEAGHTMEEIIGSVRRVNDIMNEISSASTEQSTGIDQVATAVTQMDEVTQQNAALVEEAAAAAQSLEEQAARLKNTVSVFKLHPGDVAAPVRAATTAPSAVKATPRTMRQSAKPVLKRPTFASAPGEPALAAAGAEWESF